MADLGDKNEILRVESQPKKAEGSAVENVSLHEAAETHEMLEKAVLSEAMAENPNEDIQNSNGSGSGNGDDSGVVHSSARMKPLPKEAVMRKEVAKTLKKEIRAVKRKIAWMNWPFVKFDPVKYQSLVAQLRRLVTTLESLAYATYESLKGLWLKYVR